MKDVSTTLKMASATPCGIWQFRAGYPFSNIGTISQGGGWDRHARNPVVSKTLVIRQELALIALQEIRRFRGSEHVTTVEVEHQIDSARDTNWTLHVFTREDANMERIQFAINTTRRRLRHRYNLRQES